MQIEIYAYTHTHVSIFVELSADFFSKCTLKFILFMTVIFSCCEISSKLLYAPTFYGSVLSYCIELTPVHLYVSLVNISITRKCRFSDKKLPSFILLMKRHAIVNVHINVKGSSNDSSFSSWRFKWDRFLDIFIFIFFYCNIGIYFIFKLVTYIFTKYSGYYHLLNYFNCFFLTTTRNDFNSTEHIAFILTSLLKKSPSWIFYI